MKLVLTILTLALISVFSEPVSAAQMKWVGLMAVEESPQVNQIILESGNNPAVYGPAIRKKLDQRAPGFKKARGRYCLQFYKGGRPTGQQACFRTRGIYTIDAEAAYIGPGRAICAIVPKNWPAIAGQLRYPKVGGRHVNCFDFSSKSTARGYANTRHKASMVVLIKPAG